MKGKHWLIKDQQLYANYNVNQKHKI